MAAATNATPLISLDAVVIDIETTGLDAASARIVEIGAVRLVDGRPAPDAGFRRLVRPDEPIPAAAAAIHGIDDAKVAGAAAFADVWRDFSAYVGNAVVVGHTVGFDLAAIDGECRRAGIAWTRPRTLDTRLLAEVAAPRLASYSIESLSSWLGVDIVDRHSALGDATSAARIFRALVPKLRAGGIHTLAEAISACRALTDVLDEQHRAGWLEPGEPPGRVAAERTLRRIDSYPYRHRSRDAMRSPAEFIAPNVLLRDALTRLMDKRISSLFVQPAGDGTVPPPAAETGIVTERDVMRVLAEHGAPALDLPVAGIMSRPLATVPADAFVYLAIGRMNRLRIRHLGVVDEAGRVVGALSARDLLRLRAGEAVALDDEIDHAADVHGLGTAWARLPHVAAALIGEGVPVHDIAAVISHEIGALTRQAAVIAERRMQADGLGAPPCPYALAVLGSAGRGESLLAMDQDNALVFADGAPDGSADRWFAQLAAHVADILHETGVPYCRGGVMARNPQWRGSLATWRDRIADWIKRSRPGDLLAVDIFFDMLGVHGEPAVAEALWRGAFDAGHGETRFAKLLAEAAGPAEPGLGLFGRFKTVQGRIDLKRTGLFPIATMARVLAIHHHVVERSTLARLAGIKALGLGGQRDLDALAEAHGVFLELILAQQIDDVDCGMPPTNAVAVKRLSRHERERLGSALRATAYLDELTRALLFTG